MSRSDIEKIEDRRPFYLYVDEFQNFATDSFAVILSEARKYGLNLTVANQYISQMTDSVRDAVFGNVGSMISFRVSADDAPILGKQFEPQFEPQDLIQMNNRHFVMNMVISGEKTNAFSATTLTLPNPVNDLTPKIIENTRRYYGRPRAEIEEDIRNILAPPKQFINKKMIEKQGLSPQSGWANSGVASGITPKTEKVFEPAKPMFAAPPKTKKKDFNPKKVSPNSMENQQPVNQLKDLNKILSESNPNGSEDSKASNANSNKRRRKPRARKSQNKPDFNKN